MNDLFVCMLLFLYLRSAHYSANTMINIALPNDEQRRLTFYLAMEEYVARHLQPADDCFFMWQVQPTVIFGRNQLIANEVNLDYCQRHAIQTYRRKSGGGCVYADMSNIMFSYITRSQQVQTSFEKYINMVVDVLREMGIQATTSGRNDILVDGRKVSGNAFYHCAGHSIVHGTMLYDTCMQHMVGAITPSDEKLLSKGVESVRQHICLLKDYTALSLEQFKQFVLECLCHRQLLLTADDLSIISQIEEEYLTDEFIFGNDPKCTMVKKKRIENVGELEVRLELKHNRIHQMNILGDYFVIGDVDELILKPLIGTPFTPKAISKALPQHTERAIMNLSREQLLGILF